MAIRPLYEFEEERRREIIRMHLEMNNKGRVTGPLEGAYGEIYSIVLNDYMKPTRIAAKSPRIKRFGSKEKARSGIENVLHELEKTHSIFMIPWINRYHDVQIIHGWPFILSRYRDGTLQDLITNSLIWTIEDRIATLIQIVRGLQLAASKGISAHQDLKPTNIFFDDLSRLGIPKKSKGMHFHVFIADFGIANAFLEFGRNSGSRPYMAPEQFTDTPIQPGSSVSLDIFALGVIAFEIFTDGKHPMGVVTNDVWPWNKGIPRRWDREATWRTWASTRDKSEHVVDARLPVGIRDLILESLSIDPAERPSWETFENQLWETLRNIDEDTYHGLRMQVEHIESLSSSDATWPHMEQRLMELREFYSSL